MNECVNALTLVFMMNLINDKTFKGAGQRSGCRVADVRVTVKAIGGDQDL